MISLSFVFVSIMKVYGVLFFYTLGWSVAIISLIFLTTWIINPRLSAYLFNLMKLMSADYSDNNQDYFQKEIGFITLYFFVYIYLIGGIHWTMPIGFIFFAVLSIKVIDWLILRFEWVKSYVKWLKSYFQSILSWI